MQIPKVSFVHMVALCLGTSAVCGTSSPANALNPRSWNGYTWGRTGNLSLQVVNNTDATWTPYLLTAAVEWSAAANIDFRVVSGPPVDNSVCSPVYGVIEVCNANYGKNGLLGITNVYTGGGHIVMATIKFNDYYPTTSAYYAGIAFYENLPCHGLGHALGLNHLDESRTNRNLGSCLDLTNDPAGKKAATGPKTNIAPGSMDFAALADIYAIPSGPQLPSTIFTVSAALEAVPEPAIWAMMLAGFGLVGTTMRGRLPRTAQAIV